MNEVSYFDGEDATPKEILTWANANKTTPKTAVASYERTKDITEKAKKENSDIIFIGISESMSTTCNVVRLVAKDLNYSDHVFAIDSMNLSTGIGLQLIYASKLIYEGKSASEIVVENGKMGVAKKYRLRTRNPRNTFL